MAKQMCICWNIAPENRPQTPQKGNDRIPTIHFQVRKMLVSGRVVETTIARCEPREPQIQCVWDDVVLPFLKDLVKL